jgi:O-antigen ligase
MTRESLPRRLMKENVVLLLVAMLVVIPLLTPFTYGVSGRALRNVLFQSIGVLLVVVLVARVELRGGSSRLFYLARSGANLPIAAFLLWAALGALRVAAERPPADATFAAGELLRLGAGALVYFAAALYLETRAQLGLLLDCLLAIVILVVGYGCLSQGSEAAGGLASIFPSRHHLSAILVVLFPLLLSLALGASSAQRPPLGGRRSPPSRRSAETGPAFAGPSAERQAPSAGAERHRRIAAIAAAVLGAVGLLLSLERSAWIAAAAGLLVWLFLAERTAPRARSRGAWRLGAAFAAGGLLVVLAFFAVTGVDAVVAGRAQQISAATAGRDPSFNERLSKWRGAAAMVAKQPLWGWGPGQFVLHQYAYTRLGIPPELIRPYGASFEEMAYNEYLQTAAELGLPGLALYLFLLAAFFSKASRALRRLPDGLRRTALLGCSAGVAAQMVDAMANASWRYAECSVFFWLVLGLGVALIRMGSGVQAFGRSGVQAEKDLLCPEYLNARTPERLNA